MMLALVLTPRLHLSLRQVDDAPGAPRPGGGAGSAPTGIDAEPAARLLAAFEVGTGAGLLQLGAGEAGTPLPPPLAYWRDFAARFVTALCSLPDAEDQRQAVAAQPPDQAVLAALAASAPPMTGAEYITSESLRALWDEMAAAFNGKLASARGSIARCLAEYGSAWHLVGRVHFHLAENRKDEAAPFAFVATYTDRLSAHAKPVHVPLGQALQEYGGARNKPRLLSLLLPVQRAAERCAWLKTMVEAGEIYHPLRWTPSEALALLRDIPVLEQAGVVVRVPATWKTGRPARARVTATVGGRPPSGLGLDALLDFDMGVTLEGEALSDAEVRALLAATEGLAFIRGRWVEIDPERLRRTIDDFQRAERAARAGGLSFAEAMRMVAGADVSGAAAMVAGSRDWAEVVAGPWLAQTLHALRGSSGPADPGAAFHGDLRPYQRVGVGWLKLLSSLRLGACLADDMGLGKTIQVISLLLLRQPQGRAARPGPSLLVAPASLIANWIAEIEHFAPSLVTFVAHPSVVPAEELKAVSAERLAGADLVITSYGSVARLPWIASTTWDIVIADEAQAIKNPDAKQTRALKAVQGRTRIALTGTPIENRLGDLWSIFDFLNPGLLGTAREFGAFTKRLASREHEAYAPLRELVRPYVLRRLKTDRSVIADLPEKTEMTAYCALSKRQAALYDQAVRDLRDRIREADGIERRGVVLASLMRLKQICNHPSQWLGDGAWSPDDSGKWARLTEIAEVVEARQEKMLVFTQFREITAPLAAHLAAVFGRPGLVLHGETRVSARRDLVSRFQDDESVPFFVLSLKAGGVGLNLTAASHVVHVDRWWNPAVEDQATDRAFRIGQRKNVVVHKFVCRGTVEDRIDQLIAAKRGLAKDLFEGGAELLLTEMKDDELLRLVTLDVKAALRGA